MVEINARALTTVAAVVMFVISLLALASGDMQLAGIAFFVVALLIFAREEYF